MNKTKNQRKPVAKSVGSKEGRKWLPWLLCSFIVLITFIAFSPSLKNDFVNWDDQEYVTENPLVKSEVLPLKEIFTKSVSGNYHPLTMLSLYLSYHSGYLDATGYHFVNVIFHLLNTALVFLFIFLLTKRNLLMASVVALFFGIHPMHVESVTWISERKDVMYVFFFLAGLIAYLKFINSKKAVWYVITLLLFILSCLSKGMAVVFPVVLLLVDYYLNRATMFRKKELLLKVPFFILSLFFGVVAYHYQQLDLPKTGYLGYTVFHRAMFASYGAVMYVAKFFVPIHLSAFYPYPFLDKINSIIAFPIILLSAIALIYFFLRKNKAIVFGLLFYFVTVALVLQFIPVGSAIMADRYAYLSYVGLLFPIAHIINKAWQERNTVFASLKYPLSALVIFAAILFSYKTYARTQVWRNGEALWSNVIEEYPKYYNPYRNRGEYYKNINDEEKALGDFTKTIQLNPLYHEAYYECAIIYYKRGKYDLAAEDYTKAISHCTDSARLAIYFAKRGVVYMRLKEIEKAGQDFSAAFELNSKVGGKDIDILLVNRGFYYDQTNQFEKAIADYTSYLKIKPGDDVIVNSIGLCNARLNRMKDAYDAFAKAVQLKPQVPNYWLNLSLTEHALGKMKEARLDALKAQELGMKVDSNYMNALNN